MAYEADAVILRNATQDVYRVVVPDLSASYATQTGLSSANTAIAQAQADASQGIADAAAASAAASGAQATADGKIVTFYQATAPTAAAIGDLWVDSDDRQLYRWDGTTWGTMQDTGIGLALTDASNAQATADGKITTFYNTAPPTAEGVGDLWVDTDDNNHLYRWSGTAWVSVRDATIAQAQADASTAITNAATAQATADGKVTTFFQIGPPTAEGVGDLWLDTDDGNKLYRWSGTAWTVVQDAGIGTAIANAATAQSTADGKIVSFYQTTAPTASAVGDFWIDTDDGNRLYRWSGSAWVTVRDTTIAAAQADASTAIANAATAQATADGKVTTFYQSTAPTADGVGDLWIDSTTKKMYRWNGTSWVDSQDTAIGTALSNAANAQATADGKIVTFYQTSAPTAVAVGDLWIDTDDSNKLYRWSGSAWVVVRDATIDTKVPSIGSGVGVGKTYRYPLVYSSSTASITDNLVIDTPITFGAFMCKIDISGFNYSTTNNINVESSFYAYNVGPAFVNTSTLSKGSKVVTVRLARKVSTGTVSIILTPSSGAWQYPKLVVESALVSLSTPPDSFLNGWAVSQVPEASIAASYDLVTTPALRDVLAEVSSAQSAASGAQTTADGKNTVFYQTTAPTAKAVNDLWFDTDDGNKPYRWSGSAWVAQPLGDSAIANLDAGKVTAGILQGVTVRTANTGAYVAMEPGGSADRITFPSGTTGELAAAYIQTLSQGGATPTLSIYPGSVTSSVTGAQLSISEGLMTMGSQDASGETWLLATTKLRADVGTMTSAFAITDTAATYNVPITAPNLNDGWTSYTPVLKREDTGAVLASSSPSGRYQRVGRTVHIQGNITTTNAITAGWGAIVSLPVSMASTAYVQGNLWVTGPTPPTGQSGMAWPAFVDYIVVVDYSATRLAVAAGQILRWNLTVVTS